MKMLFPILLLLIIIILAVCVFFNYARILFAPKGAAGSVCFNSSCFKVQIAKTSAERERGLMYVKELDKNKGMLFIFDKEGIYPFWMKNTLIPLDIIWADSNNKVIFISQNVQPCKTLICPTINPSVKAKHVLEVNAGIVSQKGLKIGDKLIINP